MQSSQILREETLSKIRTYHIKLWNFTKFLFCAWRTIVICFIFQVLILLFFIYIFVNIIISNEIIWWNCKNLIHQLITQPTEKHNNKLWNIEKFNRIQSNHQTEYKKQKVKFVCIYDDNKWITCCVQVFKFTLFFFYCISLLFHFQISRKITTKILRRI